MQRADRIAGVFAGLLLAAAVLGWHALLQGAPTRRELGQRRANLVVSPANLQAAAFFPLRLVFAGRITSKDPRFGGVSGLALDGGQLLALTDSGALIRFAKPAATGALTASIGEVPGGPGAWNYKRNRDSEALAADRHGRGWWVAFEWRDQLWLYDRRFQRALRRAPVGQPDWGRNSGIEGLAVAGQWLWLFPEKGGYALRFNGRSAQRVPLPGIGGPFPWQGWVAEAAALPGGKLLIAERRLSPRGFANALVVVEFRSGALRIVRRYRLPVGAADNIEAIAVEPGPKGSTRLWLMSDNDGSRFTETLLLLVELPDGQSPTVRPLRPRSTS